MTLSETDVLMECRLELCIEMLMHLCRLESRFGRCIADNQLHARAGDRLHEAVHEPRDQHPLQEAGKEEPQPILVPVSAVHRDLDLHVGRLPNRQLLSLRPSQVQSLRMVQPAPVQSRLRRRREPVHAAQQSMVHRWITNAARSLL